MAVILLSYPPLDGEPALLEGARSGFPWGEPRPFSTPDCEVHVAKVILELLVNGDRYEVATDPRRSLAEVLRQDLELIGTKIGCNQGDCGACTVLLDGRSVCSCLTLAVDAEGRAITTIEGLAPSPNELHPIRRAFVEKGAVQCGFCSSGMILSAKRLLDLDPTPDEDRIRRGVSGNLCRCTGYNKIVDAIRSAAETMAGDGENGP
jgi:carbon-monoxide dehydrogenase small subunit